MVDLNPMYMLICEHTPDFLSSIQHLFFLSLLTYHVFSLFVSLRKKHTRNSRNTHHPDHVSTKLQNIGLTLIEITNVQV